MNSRVTSLFGVFVQYIANHDEGKEMTNNLKKMVIVCLVGAMVGLVAAGPAMAGRCSGISSPVFCDDFDRWCVSPPVDPDGACDCTLDDPDQAGFEAFWPDEGCSAPHWPEPGYESNPHTLVANGSWKCDPPEHTQGYGAQVWQSSGGRLVGIRRHEHDMTEQIVAHPDNEEPPLPAINGSDNNGLEPIMDPYAYPDVHPDYVDSMDRALRPQALKGQFFVPTGTCGHYGRMVFYVELFLDDDRAPTNFTRVDCEQQNDAKGRYMDCICEYEGQPVSCSGTCDPVAFTCSNTGAGCAVDSDCSFCVDGTCTNTGRACTVDSDCMACLNGPLDGMSCTDDPDCHHGPFWQVVPSGDGVAHNSLAIGFMALLDSNPCYDGTNVWPPAKWRLVVFNGFEWQSFKAPAFDIPMTPGDPVEGDNWDFRPWDSWNIVKFAIGEDYMEVRLYNNRATAYHAGAKCITQCGDKECAGGVNDGYGCTSDADCPLPQGPVDCVDGYCVGGTGHDWYECTTPGDCPTAPALPNEYFVARVPRQDDPDGDLEYGPFNKIAIGPGKGLDETPPTCVNYGTELDPWPRCFGGPNDGGECPGGDPDCQGAPPERCMEISIGQNALILDELVLYDGVFEPHPGAVGACCKQDDWGSGHCVDMTEEEAQTQCIEPDDDWKGVGIRCSSDPCEFCPDPFADTDRDTDVDQDDLGKFQACITGHGGGVPTGCECFNQHVDVDDPDIDEDDYAAFELCASGPDVAADPFCDG